MGLGQDIEKQVTWNWNRPLCFFWRQFSRLLALLFPHVPFQSNYYYVYAFLSWCKVNLVLHVLFKSFPIMPQEPLNNFYLCTAFSATTLNFWLVSFLLGLRMLVCRCSCFRIFDQTKSLAPVSVVILAPRVSQVGQAESSHPVRESRVTKFLLNWVLFSSFSLKVNGKGSELPFLFVLYCVTERFHESFVEFGECESVEKNLVCRWTWNVAC